MSPKPASSWQSGDTNVSIGQLNATVSRFLTTLPDTPEKSVFSSPVTVRPQRKIARSARRIPDFQDDMAAFDWTEESGEKKESDKDETSQREEKRESEEETSQRRGGSQDKRESEKDESPRRREDSEERRELGKAEKSQKGAGSEDKRESDKDKKSQREDESDEKSDKGEKSQRREEVKAAEREEGQTASGSSWAHYQAERKRKGKLRVSESSEPEVEEVSSKPEEGMSDEDKGPQNERAAFKPEEEERGDDSEIEVRQKTEKKRGSGNGTKAAPITVDLSSDDEETKVKLERRKRLNARRLEARKKRLENPSEVVDLTGDVPVQYEAVAKRNAIGGQEANKQELSAQPGSLRDRLQKGDLTLVEYLEQTKPLLEDLENLAEKQERERIEGGGLASRFKRAAAENEQGRPLRRARRQEQTDELVGGFVGSRSSFGLNSGLGKSLEEVEASAQKQERERVEGRRSPSGAKRLAAEIESERPVRRARAQEQPFRRDLGSGSSQKEQETSVEVAARAEPSTPPVIMSQPENFLTSIEKNASGQGQPAEEAQGCRDSEQQPLSQEKERSLGVDRIHEQGNKEGADVQNHAEEESFQEAFENDAPDPAEWDDPLEDAGQQEASAEAETSYSAPASVSAAAVQTSSSSDAESAEKEHPALTEKSAEATDATLRESRDTTAIAKMAESPLGSGFVSSASPSKTMESPLGRGFVSPASPGKRSVMWGRTFSVKTGEEISPNKRPFGRKVSFQSVFLKLVAYGDCLVTSQSIKAKAQEWKGVQKAKNVEELKYWLAWLPLTLARGVKQREAFWRPWKDRVERCDTNADLSDLLGELQAAVASCSEQTQDVTPAHDPPPTPTDEIRLPESSDPPINHGSTNTPEASAAPSNEAAALSARVSKQNDGLRGRHLAEGGEAAFTGSRTRSSLEAEMPDAADKNITPRGRRRGQEESSKGRAEKVLDTPEEAEISRRERKRRRRSDEMSPPVAAKTSPKPKKVKVTPKRADRRRSSCPAELFRGPSSESSKEEDSAEEGQTESAAFASAEENFQSPASARKADLMRQRLKRLEAGV